ncbi:MAG: MOSC domain-containing protein [Pseudomonadota bacterium]
MTALPATTIAALTTRYAQPGIVTWIGLRPERLARVEAVRAADVTVTGLGGDHRAAPGKRAVTLIQAEHLPVIAALCGAVSVDPASLRRNIVISGINLLGLRSAAFRIGTVRLRGTGLCAPCSRIETALGHGGYAATRGHGGITAEVLAGGQIAIGDPVKPTGDRPDPIASQRR